MGVYINPSNARDAIEKGAMIAGVSRQVTLEEFAKHNPGENNEFGVVLVDNMIFIAAAVAYNRQERDYFVQNPDERPKMWLITPFDEIAKLDPGCASHLKEYMA